MIDGASGNITQEQVDAFRWFHSIDFGGGVVAEGKVKTLEAIAAEAEVIFAHGVRGKTVLDIGALDGAYSFEAIRRGARPVTAVDTLVWAGLAWSGKATFDLANAAFGNPVSARIADVYDMTAANSGTHDVVLFLGVLYHLKHPLLALERVAGLTRQCAILETATDHNDNPAPFMRFIPDDSLGGDGSVWWLPNIACVTAWLQMVGFKRIDVTPHPMHPHT